MYVLKAGKCIFKSNRLDVEKICSLALSICSLLKDVNIFICIYI